MFTIRENLWFPSRVGVSKISMNPRTQAKRKFVLWVLIAGVVGLGLGMIIGRFGFCDDTEKNIVPGIPDAIVQDGDPEVTAEIINQINSENIRRYLE